MARLRWTPQAIEDIEAICAYIERDSPVYARIFASRTVDRISSLESFPKAGRIVPESDREDVREIIDGNYRIIYRLLHDEVQILTVHHSARLLDLSAIPDT